MSKSSEKVRGKSGRVVDVILVTIIGAALIVIGLRLTGKMNFGQNGAEPSQTSAEGDVISSKPISAPVAVRTSFGYQPQAALSKQRTIDDVFWKEWLAKEKFTESDQTKRCAMKPGEPDGVYQVIAKELRDVLVANSGGVVARFGGRKCHQVGQRIRFVYFGNEPDEPYLAELGEFVVKGIVEFDREKASDDFWNKIGVDPLAVRSIRNPYPDITLLRVNREEKSSTVGMGLPEHFRYPKLGSSDLLNMQKNSASNPTKFVTLDLRDRAIRETHPIRDAIVIDPSSALPAWSQLAKFQSELKVREVEKIPLDIQKLSEAQRGGGGKTVFFVLVGNSSTDARPLLLMKILSDLEIARAGWYVDDVAKLSEILKE